MSEMKLMTGKTEVPEEGNGQKSCANAQETQMAHTGDVNKKGFIKIAFRDMKESAKLQHQIDKANPRAQKLEIGTFYEERKRHPKPS